ncbi:MAG: THUMP domain-containing protein [Promethearchaeota archaeon]
MSESTLQNSQIEYTLIIARYVEIGLKSRKVRNRMERRLLKHILSVCDRENLEVSSSLRRWGRLEFEFQASDIPHALVVFRNIIGVHSYSPVMKISADYPEIQQSTVDFAKKYLKSGDGFAVRVKRFKTYFKTSIEMERELGSLIYVSFEQKNSPLHVDLTSPDKTIHLEIKEKFSYLFGEIFYTAWGGNPIETDKAMFMYWDRTQGNLAASFLLTRRGAVVIPVLFYNGFGDIDMDMGQILAEDPETENHLSILARYYADDLPVILLNNSSAIPLLQEALSESVEKMSFNTKLACFSLFLINKLNSNSDIKQKLTYMHKSMTTKGCINGFHPQLTSQKRNSSQFLKYAQFQPLAHFLPLLGLNIGVFKEMENSLLNPPESLITTEFSLTSLIIQDFDSTKAPDTSLNKKISGNEVSQQILDPKREMELLDLLNQVFESTRFSSIVDQILTKAEIVRIRGKKI